MFSRENLDPTPDIHALFNTFNFKFFSGQLSCVELEWSLKMYQCAGICYSRRNRMGMACTIRLSEPLLKLRPRKDLVETLLHEMIHAWNFIRGISEENGGHGQNFLQKMHEINRVAGTKISVYHTFNDEVDLYKTHWWRCDGPCKNRQPYFGFVKRTCNRAPGSNDRWWKEHDLSCGGNFVKVKEPEKGEKKTKVKKVKPALPSPKSPSCADIRKYFKPTEKDEKVTPKLPSGNIELKASQPTASFMANTGGHTLGGASSGRSRLLDMFDDKKRKTDDNFNDKAKKRRLYAEDEHREIVVIDDSFEFHPPLPSSSFHDRVTREFDDDDIILIDDEFDDSFLPKVLVNTEPKDNPSDTCNCPCCNISIEISKINEHLDLCLGI